MNRDKRHIDEGLLIRNIAGETSREESAAVQQWVDLSDENKSQYQALRKIWAATENPSKAEPADVNVDAAWNNMRSRMHQYAEIESKHAGKTRSLFFYLSGIAAVLVVGALVFAIYKYQTAGPATVQLASGDATITDNLLPDGTIIALNQHTSIEYRKEFSEKERKVKLSGEAFFDVEPDKTRPFIIEAQDAVITVLGTSFNVKAMEEDIAVEVLVEEGLVELANPDKSQSTTLHIGEKGIYIRETREVKKETELDPESLYWLNKTLLFRETELSVVFETLERLYKVKITVENQNIRKCLLTAKFSNETIDHIIDHISTIFEFEIKKDDKNILISGDGCP
jgi:ferric-dicitrate binding protein FerR (iron transport regulator)